MTHEEMIAGYKATTAASAYIVGFAHHDRVYEMKASDLPAWMFKADRASTSHGGETTLRLRLTKSERYTLINKYGAALIGTVEEILKGAKNKGEAWEKYQTEKAGQEWKKDSIPYYLDGDLTVDGIKYQIKFDGATFAKETTIQKALGRA